MQKIEKPKFGTYSLRNYFAPFCLTELRNSDLSLKQIKKRRERFKIDEKIFSKHRKSNVDKTKEILFLKMQLIIT